MATSSPSPPPAPAPRAPSPTPSAGSDAGFEPAEEVVAAYHRLMAALLPDLPPAPPATSLASASLPAPEVDDDAAAEAALGRPLTKAEKQNAKKRRRKERERALRDLAAAAAGELPPPPPRADDVPVSFRLFSTDQQPRPVSLSTREVVPPTPNPRLQPLPAHVRERIARLAAEAAVDAPAPPVAPSEVGAYTVSAGAVLPVLFVARGSEKSAAKAVPVLRLAEVLPPGEEAAPRKRRRVRPPRERPAPALWRPQPGIGGKSAGYAYGWGG
ncbi:hypothetical protein Q8F55_007435 [Vanrija albida]|uniref:Uncharacterized protein n=1 Tax=Vanrija albida TaxID=181172 RepID=A0ABR3PTI3_9TREE